MDEIDGHAGERPNREISSPTRAGAVSAGMGRRFRVGGHVPHPVRSEPEASATAQARGLAGRSGSPRLETGPGIGNGDAAVADASGSDVRDRPQDWLSGS